jgi:hypothetical protein
MKSGKLAVIGVLAIALAVSGCATKRYGRLTSVSPMEMDKLSCEMLSLELAKVEQFELDVEKGAELNWKSIAGFLGDYGIGNTLEKNAAVKSAKERKAQLREAQSKKGCV